MAKKKWKYLAIGNMSFGQAPTPWKAIEYMVAEHPKEFGRLEIGYRA